MTEETIVRRRVVRGDDEVVEDRPAAVYSTPSDLISRIVYFVVGLVEAVLALRFLLQLLGANRGAGFVDFIYDLTAPLVTPFFGMFGSTPTFAGGSRFEAETLVAMVAYAILGWVLVSILRMVGDAAD